MNTNWIEFNATTFDRADSNRYGDISVEISLSPYDIPSHFRCGYTPDAKKYVIEFRYISDEPTSQKELSDHVQAIVGKNSGRLYGLVVNVEGLANQEKECVVLDYLDKAKNSEPLLRDRRSELNRQLISTVDNVLLKNSRDQLTGTRPVLKPKETALAGSHWSI